MEIRFQLEAHRAKMLETATDGPVTCHVAFFSQALSQTRIAHA